MKPLFLILILTTLLSGCFYDDMEFDDSDFIIDSAFNYEYVPANTGDMVTIDSTNYYVYKVPLVDKYNGEYYHLTVLSSDTPNVQASRFNEIEVTPNNYAPSRLVYIDSHPALVNERCTSSVSNSTLYNSCFVELVIRINELMVNVQIAGTYSPYSYQLTGGGNDLASVAYPDLTPFDMDAHVNTFINYMKIEAQ